MTVQARRFIAVIAHDPWRDSYKKSPLEGTPAEWAWPQRPGRRPKTTPESAPRGLLGLTLADTTESVQHEDVIPSGQGPVIPPLTAISDDKDVLSRVAKRLPYSPAGIPDERDDRTSVGGRVTVTFPPLKPLPPELSYEAALYLRCRGQTPEITVNGLTGPLFRLGHNADRKRGWHPCVVPVLAAQTYDLSYTGRISLIGLAVRIVRHGLLED